MCKVAAGAAGFLIFAGVFSGAYAKKDREPASDRSFQKPLSKDQKIEQALNRLTFGPRPGDVAQVEALGLKKWIDLELHPNRI